MERIKRLNDNGYTTIHLFGDWYFCRKYSKNYRKWSFWHIRKFEEK